MFLPIDIHCQFVQSYWDDVMSLHHVTKWWTELEKCRDGDHTGRPGTSRTVVNTAQVEELTLGEWINTWEEVDINIRKWLLMQEPIAYRDRVQLVARWDNCFSVLGQ